MAMEQTNTQVKITPDEALERCLDAMEGASKLPFQAGLRQKIRDRAYRPFVENHDHWDRFKGTVLRSSSQIGTFAEAFARFEGEINERPATEVREHHADEAIRVVRRICPAGLAVGPRFRWCPDPEA